MVRPPRSALPTKPAVVALVRRSLLEFVLNVCQVWLGVRTRSMTRTGSMTRRRYSSRSTLHSFSYAVGAWGENGDASPGPRMARVISECWQCKLFQCSLPEQLTAGHQSRFRQCGSAPSGPIPTQPPGDASCSEERCRAWRRGVWPRSPSCGASCTLPSVRPRCDRLLPPRVQCTD